MAEKEYIEREAALLVVEEWADTFCDCDYVFPYILESIKKLPAADVRPVVRGEWKIYHKTNIAVCKCCSYQYMMGAPWHEYPPRFCPNCGADMRPQPPKEE